MTEKTMPVHGLTKEALTILGAPVPDAEKKQRQGFGGKMLTYTSTEFVEDRASSVDLSWEDHYTATETRGKYGVVGTMVCDLTILGVTRSGSSGYFVPDDISYTGRDGNKQTRPVNNDDVHTITTAAQARAQKRAAAKFSIARELWMDTNETRAAAATSTGTSQPAQSSNGTERRPSSPKQISTLFDWYMVPKDITVLLTGGMGGEASRLYDYVKAKKAEVGDDTYKSNANYYIKAALEYINKEVAAKVPAGVALAESDGFDDPD